MQRQVPAEEANELNANLSTYVPIFCGHGAFVNCLPTYFGRTLNVVVIQISKNSGLEQRSEKADQISIELFAHWVKDA